MKWRIRDRHSLYWKDWEDGSAVYDSFSGRTHVLNLMARLVLIELEESGAASAEELTRRLRALLDLQPGDTALDGLDKLMAQLTGVGLVELSPEP